MTSTVKPITVIPRRLRSEGTPVLFLPEVPVNPGRIMSYMRIGQHSEASLGFYSFDTVTVKETDADVQSLLEEYDSIPPRAPLRITSRLDFDLLCKEAWGQR